MIDHELAGLKEQEQKKMNQEKRKMLLLGIAGITLFLIVWQLVSTLRLMDPRLFASPVEVCKLMFTKLTDVKPDGALLQDHILSSLKVALSGYFLAVIIGVPLGLLMGWYKLLDRFISPLFEILRPLPPIAWIPFTVIFLGIGLLAKASIVFLSAFIPCLINSYTGIKLTNPIYINVAKTCGATKWETFWKVGIPSALPMVFGGMKTSLGGAWSTLVAAEMLAANMGLGYMISMGRTYGKTSLIMLGMLLIGLIGILFLSTFDMLEKRILKWRR